MYCTCTTTEVNICYERRYEGTTEVSYESIKESTCSCTVHVRVHYCLLRTEEGIFVRKYFRKYFRKYESTTMYGSNDNDTRTVCYRTIFILKMTQIYWAGDSINAVVLPYTVLSTVPSYEGRIYSMQLHARCEDMQGILIYKKVGS